MGLGLGLDGVVEEPTAVGAQAMHVGRPARVEHLLRVRARVRVKG